TENARAMNSTPTIVASKFFIVISPRMFVKIEFLRLRYHPVSTPFRRTLKKEGCGLRLARAAGNVRTIQPSEPPNSTLKQFLHQTRSQKPVKCDRFCLPV